MPIYKYMPLIYLLFMINMMRKIFSLSLVIVLTLSLFSVFYTMPTVYAKKKLPSTIDVDVKTRIEKKLSLLKGVATVDKSLNAIDRPTRVIAAFVDEVDPGLLSRHMVSVRVLPQMGNVFFVLGTLLPGNHEELLNDRNLLMLYKDIPIAIPKEIYENIFAAQDKESLISYLRNSRKGLLEARISSLELNRSSIGLTMRDVNEIIESEDVWEYYNINGSNITVAVVDTGVDYGSFGLGYWDTVSRASNGTVTPFDADATGIVFTNITVVAYSNASGVFINTTGTDPVVYIYGSEYRFSWLTGTLFPADMNVTGILNPGDVAHFGVMFQYLFGTDLFPVLVVDSNADNTYDTVYVDISYDWYVMFLNATPDYSFVDETPLKADGWSIGARDFTNDGYYDISVSSLGYGIDVYWVVPNVFDRGGILKPIDPYGNYTVFVSDFYGHGTSVANVIAGRDVPHPLYGPGVAPGAKIMGIVALFMGDIIESWLWAAGFDLVPGTEGWQSVPGYGYVYGYWVYKGEHKADIISNSWGWSSWAYYFGYAGLPWYDILTIFEDSLTVPGYLDPAFPGVVMVHAAGNGGPGYGTVTEPGYNTLAITVGAATSLDSIALYTQVLYGSYGYVNGSFDQVIPWSARGPTAFGMAKPDILGIGAYGWTAGPVWYGFGNGFSAYELFGGTSMATPVIAGVSALVKQASNLTGYNLTPAELKAVLMSTAVDLGYDALTQGAGRVDAYTAVSALYGNTGLFIGTAATYDNMYNKLWFDPWLIAYYYSAGYSINFAPPAGPIYTVSWFAGDLLPGQSSQATYKLHNPTSTPIDVKLSAVKYESIGSQSFTIQTGVYEWLGNYYMGALIPLNKTDIPADTDLMIISTNISYSTFDANGNYDYDNEVFIYLFDWNDANTDGVPQANESIYVSFSATDGTTQEIKVGRPLDTFQFTPLLRIRQAASDAPYTPINVTVTIRYLKRAPWSWVSFSSTAFTVAPSTTQSPLFTDPFNVTLTVPSGTAPGLYHGQIIVNMTTIGRVLAIPVTVNVYETVASTNLTQPLNITDNDPLYSAGMLYGYFDWGWRAESGDWRLWNVYLNAAPNMIGAFVIADWVNPNTDVDMFSVDPWGWVIDSSEYMYLGSGTFMWFTRTGTTEEYVALWPESGPQTVILHNVLFDGSQYPEPVSGRIAFTYLNALDLKTVNIQGSLSESYLKLMQRFEIETGLTLTNFQFTPLYLPDGFKLEFPTINVISGNSSKKFPVSVLVPTDTEPGNYQVSFRLTADQFPYYIDITLSIEVRPFPLPLSMSGTTSGGSFNLDLPGEYGTLTIYRLFNPIDPSQNIVDKYQIIVDNIVLGDHITIIYFRMKYGPTEDHQWWFNGLMFIDKDSNTVYFFSVISFQGKYS